MSRILRSKTFKVLLGLALVVGILWVALPGLVTSYVNSRLARLENYTGEVDRVSFNLWRGAFRLEDLRLHPRAAPEGPAFFRAEAIDLSIDTRALLGGAMVAEVDLHEPKVNYGAKARPKEPEPSWQEMMEDLAPFRIDRLTVHDGSLTYKGKRGRRALDVSLQNVNASMRNLTNSADLAEDRFARFEGRAVAMNSGQLTFQGKANPAAKQPTFELELELEELELSDVDGFLTSTAGFQAGKGTLSLDADLNASGGRVKGLANASLEDLSVTDIRREKQDLAGRLWDRARQAAAPHIGEPRSRNVRVRVPVDFQLDDPMAGIVSAASEIVQTAVTRALRSTLEDALPLPGLRREN